MLAVKGRSSCPARRQAAQLLGIAAAFPKSLHALILRARLEGANLRLFCAASTSSASAHALAWLLIIIHKPHPESGLA
jgi:hypothetical protein